MKTFPIITDLNQFTNILKNKPEIKLKKEMVDGIEVGIICYNIEKDTTFNSDLAKECRGIVFDLKTGKLLSRPFHKFFNINQKEETLISKINWNKINYIGSKWDGSLIVPVLINDKIYWKTKKSFYSEIAQKANATWNEKYVGSIFERSILMSLRKGETPLFEFLDNENPIVIKYNEIGFKYLSTRNNLNGNYTFNVNLATDFKKRFDTIEYFVDFVKALPEVEGYVIGNEFELYKVKTQWYLERHRMLSKFTINNILDLYINDVIDDYLSELYTFEYYDKAKVIEKFRDEFTNWILDKEERTKIRLEELKNKYKHTELRIQISQETNSALLFQILDGKDTIGLLKKQLRVHFKDVYKNKVFFMGEEI